MLGSGAFAAQPGDQGDGGPAAAATGDVAAVAARFDGTGIFLLKGTVLPSQTPRLLHTLWPPYGLPQTLLLLLLREKKPLSVSDAGGLRRGAGIVAAAARRRRVAEMDTFAVAHGRPNGVAHQEPLPLRRQGGRRGRGFRARPVATCVKDYTTMVTQGEGSAHRWTAQGPGGLQAKGNVAWLRSEHATHQNGHIYGTEGCEAPHGSHQTGARVSAQH